jgi:hypothetical protein
MTLSKTTTDHDEIRKWAEARGAVPAEVRKTHKGNEPGILRFCFPDAANRNDSNLREISWEEFFEKFDESNLELLYQEKTAEGELSNFNKLIHPESEGRSERRKTSPEKKTASGTKSHTAKKTEKKKRSAA